MSEITRQSTDSTVRNYAANLAKEQGGTNIAHADAAARAKNKPVQGLDDITYPDEGDKSQGMGHARGEYRRRRFSASDNVSGKQHNGDDDFMMY